MNHIEVKAPRWRDRTVLVAKFRVATNNQIEITAKRKDGTRYFPEAYEMDGKDLMKYPIHHMTSKSGNDVEMLVVPIDDLKVPTKELRWDFR